MKRKYKINYEGHTTKNLYEGYPTVQGDYIVFKSIDKRNDFRLNRYFWKGYRTEHDLIYIR